MGKFKGGADEAAKILQEMGMGHANNLLDIIAEKDPHSAKLLKEKMVGFEDLIYLTPKMLVDLFKVVKPETMGLALRVGSKELKDHILNNVSTAMHVEMDYILKGPLRSVNEVQEAVDKIMTIVREKLEKGELLINGKDGDKLV
jgi:flagellar motor switch protein FliG